MDSTPQDPHRSANQSQKEHYDSYYSSEKSSKHLVRSEFKDDFLDYAIGHLRPSRNDHILEIGAGHGIMTKKLLSYGSRVTAVDISDSAISNLNEIYRDQIASKQLTTSVSDVDAVLADNVNSYTAIAGSGILHHLPDLDKLFENMYNALCPGGRVLFAPEPNASGLYGLAWRFLAAPTYRLMNGNFDWEVEKGTLNIAFKPLSEKMRLCGFHNIHFLPYQTIPHFQIKTLREIDRQLIKNKFLGRGSLYLTIYAEKP